MDVLVRSFGAEFGCEEDVLRDTSGFFSAEYFLRAYLDQTPIATGFQEFVEARQHTLHETVKGRTLSAFSKGHDILFV